MFDKTGFQISKKGIAFITQPSFDSFQSKPYRDSGGLWTIGFGRQINNQLAVDYRSGITKEVATKWLLTHLENDAKDLAPLFRQPLLQHQQDAILCLVFNIGINAFKASTILPVIQAQTSALDPWLWWNKDDRQNIQPGLVKRRKMELKLFIYGVYH